MGVPGSGNDNNNGNLIIKGEEFKFTIEEGGLGCFFYKYFVKNKNAVAQRDGITGLKDTYGDLIQRCINTAIEMRARGIQRGDIVSICSYNHLNSCVPLISSMFIGVKVASLDPTLSFLETVHLLKQASPKLIFVSPESVEFIEKATKEAEVPSKLVVFGPSTVHYEFGDFFAPKPNSDFLPIIVEDDHETAIIHFSSGTTGMPKGICISHHTLLSQAYILAKYISFNYDVILTYATFYWISTTLTLVACTLVGGSRLIVPRFNIDSFWKLLSQFHATCAFLPPTHSMMIYNKGRPEGIDTSHLEDLLIGGGPLSSSNVTKVRDIFPGSNVGLVYGQTETGGLALSFSSKIRKHLLLMYNNPGSTGKVLPGYKLKIVDPETEETLGVNQRGELRIKSTIQFNEYYNCDSSGAWDSEGWLKTGDVAYYDEERCFYVVDRLKEMLKFQSFHVAPAVIEGVLLSHPAVAMAIVVGIPDAVDGDHPVGIIILKDPTKTIPEEEFAKYVSDKLDDRHRLRGGVKILSQLPVTATGKIRRKDMRDMVIEGAADIFTMAFLDDKILTAAKLPYIPHPGGLGCAMFEKMWEYGDKYVQIDGYTGKKETYQELLKRCIRSAIAMRSAGVREDDVITICSVAHMDICVPYISSTFIGAKPTTVDPTLTHNDVVHLLQQVNPKLIFVAPEAIDLIEKAVKQLYMKVKIVVFGKAKPYIAFQSFMKSTKDEDNFKPLPVKSLKETAIILFSSGTSGLPKGICITHYGILSQCHACGYYIPVIRSLTFASFYWISTIGTMIATVLYGGCRIVVSKFEPSKFWSIMETHKPTMMFTSPSLIVDVVKLERPPSAKNPSLQVALISGAAVSEKALHSFQEIFKDTAVLVGYAQTETGGAVTYFNPRDAREKELLKKKPLSSGRVLPGFSIKIADPDSGRILGTNERGEIRIKSEFLFRGYYEMESGQTFDTDGWYKTGDIAYYDEDRCLFIVDRIKEVLKYRSFQVPPAAVEAVILDHPDVESAVVFGIPHEEDGEHPMALVVLSMYSKGVTASDIQKFVDERVNEYQKLRGGVKIIDYIPLTCTGKVRRYDLKAKVLRGEL